MSKPAPTKVIFRVWHNNSGVIALFPEEPGTNNAYTCSSYEHVGQHGAADPVNVIQLTRPAKPDEYADLKAELERIGYALKVCQRITRESLDVRRAKLSPKKVVLTFSDPRDAEWVKKLVQDSINAGKRLPSGASVGILLDSIAKASTVSFE